MILSLVKWFSGKYELKFRKKKLDNFKLLQIFCCFHRILADIMISFWIGRKKGHTNKSIFNGKLDKFTGHFSKFQKTLARCRIKG